MSDDEGVVKTEENEERVGSQENKDEITKSNNNEHLLESDTDKQNEEEKDKNRSVKTKKSSKLFASSKGPEETEVKEEIPSDMSGVVNTHHAIDGSSHQPTISNNIENKSLTTRKGPVIINVAKMQKPIVKVKIIRKKKSDLIRVSFVYKRNQYIVFVKPEITFAEFQNIISERINLKINEMEVKYKDVLYKSPENDNEKITDIAKNEKFPCFEVKKIYNFINANSYSMPRPQLYNYKVIIDHIPSSQEIYRKVDEFFNNNLLNKDYIAIPLSRTKYSIEFPYPVR